VINKSNFIRAENTEDAENPSKEKGKRRKV